MRTVIDPDEINYARLPDYMQPSTRRYIEEGHPVGDFLTAVICDNLGDAVCRADMTNRTVLREWVLFFHNEAPGKCHGSREKMKTWIKHGGLKGLLKEDEDHDDQATS